MNKPLVRAEIDLDAISHNIGELLRITSSGASLMAVVKADAYGHGMIEVAKQALKSGAKALGVARIDEAVKLREAGIGEKILIFGYPPASEAERLFEFDLSQTVYSYNTAESLSKLAFLCGKSIRIHLKVDTGMGRVGLLPDFLRPSASSGKPEISAALKVLSLSKLPGLELEGIFTHFAAADRLDRSYADRQFEIFMDFIDQLRASGLEIPVKHAANSAAIIQMPKTHLDMVRAGITIYGLYPSDEIDKSRIALKPAMELKTRVIHLKAVPAGFNVSYGMTYKTGKPTIIATVPVGYADGYNRGLSSKGCMLVRGRKAPVIGRVCMDMTMLDVGHIPEIEVGDEAVIFGKQKNLSISADEIASALNTINYEIVSAITDRIPRIYYNSAHRNKKSVNR